MWLDAVLSTTQDSLHTYAFFIDKKADFVTPVPDQRLARDSTFSLAEDLGVDAATVTVVGSAEAMSAITGFFVRNSVTLQVEDELITYTGASKSPPYRFTGCQRGACGTRVAWHPRGSKLGHLKECFGLFVPDPETTLLAQVAQRTADFYNECGFDMIYLDALDGEDILGGGENGWHFGSQFVFEIVQRLRKPALMEMSTFHHHLWYVRSRAGAWDHPEFGQGCAAVEVCAATAQRDDRRQNRCFPDRTRKWQLFGDEFAGGLQHLWAEGRTARPGETGRRNPRARNRRQSNTVLLRNEHWRQHAHERDCDH